MRTCARSAALASVRAVAASSSRFRRPNKSISHEASKPARLLCAGERASGCMPLLPCSMRMSWLPASARSTSASSCASSSWRHQSRCTASSANSERSGAEMATGASTGAV
jgi:hypothetical protein